MSRSDGFFVVGTDTEVGKTLVSGALILKLRGQGRKVVGFKPVVAGTYQDESGVLLNEDLEKLRIASDISQDKCNYVHTCLTSQPHLIS